MRTWIKYTLNFLRCCMEQTKTLQENKSKELSISVCEVMKNNTSDVIKKMESQIPSYIQLYSDYYKEYLHTVDDAFGTCFVAEKEFLDRLGISEGSVKMFDSYLKQLTRIYGSQIDMSTNLLRVYLQWRISAIKSYDSYVHLMTQSFSKALSQFNSICKK